MVRIIGFKKRQKEDKEFFVLEISGGIEMVLSKATGQYYATAKKAYISSTFDEQTCKALIGTEMTGNVVKQACEPYEYTNRDSGEVMVLEHRYIYVPETKQSEPIKQPIQQDFATEIETFSKNGKYELEAELV